MKRMLRAILLIIVLATHGLAQAPRTPGAEEARIGYFAGRWTLDFDVKPSPMGPGSKFTVSETCEWFVGGFHLVCRAEGTGPRGAFTQQAIIGYDPAEKTYTYYEFNSSGEAMLNRGTVSGQLWTWQGETTVEGKRIQGRTTVTEQSATSYVAKFEVSIDGGPWMVAWENRATKVR